MPEAKSKLTKTQVEVMTWMSQGWGARVPFGASVEINGKRVCNLSTITALEGMGLVARDPEHSNCWEATAEGRKLSPQYQPPKGV